MFGQRLRDCKLQLMEIEKETNEHAWPCRPLRFCGIMRQLRKDSLDTTNYPTGKRKFVVRTEDDLHAQGLVYFDTTAEEPQTLYFCPFGTWNDNALRINCLALVRHGAASSNRFRRVGFGEIQDIDGVENGDSMALKLFEVCHRLTFWIL